MGVLSISLYADGIQHRIETDLDELTLRQLKAVKPGETLVLTVVAHRIVSEVEL